MAETKYEWKVVVDLDQGPSEPKVRVAMASFKAGELDQAVKRMAVYRREYACDLRSQVRIQLRTWVEDELGIASTSGVYLHWAAGEPYINGCEVGRLTFDQVTPSEEAREEVQRYRVAGSPVVEL